MSGDGFLQQLPDIDSLETEEWRESLATLVDTEGDVRAQYILNTLLEEAHARQIPIAPVTSTPYINTIPTRDEPSFPGDEKLEKRIRRIIRWNAAVMVTRANKHLEGIGGHISTYASVASLFEVGFNHFFHGSDTGTSGDQVYFQGHAAPGIYSRAYLEGRLTEEHLDNFRQEVGGKGLSSYPHPRLMPEFWQFPTVSMGLGPLNAIYQARFNRYLLNRGLVDTSASHVWAFLGDGESDEPETFAALSLAAREQLDNLTFVVSCNLQRLDGPVRGNGKIIQELESVFRGAGWNVIKVIWGREWDPLIAADVDGILLQKMNTTNDGEFQRLSTESGAYIREHFFGPDARLRELVRDYSDDQLMKLRRGGHDYQKLYTAYDRALSLKGAPTVILAHTIKGWALGTSFEGRNATHQIKKLADTDLRSFRDTLELPITDAQLAEGAPPYFHPGAKSEEVEYLLERRRALGGMLPKRHNTQFSLALPDRSAYKDFLAGSGGRPASTTSAFVGVLRNLLRDPEIGKRVVPIIPDEARTFGMESLFKEIKIYAPFGQQYEPVDANMILSYQESQSGQLLEEGITEAGATASFSAAGTAYSTHRYPMIPFFIYYSMFGFQRIGDLAWAAGDMRGRGFLLGGTAGRTTLNGEGLQHEDGQSPLLFSVVPNVNIYDPAYAYELALIIEEGMQRMYHNNEDVFYYLTVYNENYPMPPMPEGIEKDLLRGLYRLAPPLRADGPEAHLVSSGSAMAATVEAQRILSEEHGIAATVWSAPGWHQLYREALEMERWNLLHPAAEKRMPHVTASFTGTSGPVIAVSDYMKTVTDRIARFIPNSFTALGTDGYGRSDSRQALRSHFEVDAPHIAAAALSMLAQDGTIPPEKAEKALAALRIDTEKADPRYL